MYKTKYSGAAATIVGAQSEIKNENDNQEYSGVANGIYGSANTIKNSNGVTIQGSGNTVTDAYKDMNIGFLDGLAILGGDYSVLAKKESGAVAVVGGANTVSKQTDSTVIGYANKLTSDKEKGSQNVFMAGSHNTLTNVSDSLVMGNDNTISDRSNVISFGYKNAITANNAVAIGNGASVSSEGGVALGVGSVADRANAVSVGSTGANRQIINVAAGEADTDAVNVSQLKKATANANKGWKLSTEGGTANQVASEATVDFSGKKDAGGHQNITVSNEGNNVKIELASELKNVTGVVNGNSRVTLGTGIAGITNGQESVIMMNGSTTINGVVGIDNTGKISGVANGEADKDAVNYGQLKDVKAEALKHSTVTDGANITVTPVTKEDGHTEYNVALNKDIFLSGDNADAYVNISGSKGTIWASGSVTAGSVVAGKVIMDGTTATVSGLSNKTTAYDGFATTGKAATEEQLKEVATEAGKHTQVKAGTNVGIVSGETADGTHVYTVNADGTTVSGDSNVVVTAGAKDVNNVTNYGVKLNKDLKGIESVSNGNAKLTLSSHPFFGTTAELTNGQASVSLMGGSTKINGKVEVRQDGTIGGVTAGRSDKDAVNVSQLNNVKAEALKHTTLSDGKNTTVKSTVKDGQTDYKVNIAGDLTDITSVSNGDAKLALNGEAGVAGIINGQGASVYMQGSTTVINNKVSVDKDGKISGVAAGTADTDAVNYGQLKKVSDTANAGWTLSTNGNATAGTNVTPGAFVDFSGDNNVSVSNEGTAVSVKLNNALKDIESISNGDAKLALNGAAGTAGIINGQGASVYMQGSTTVINSKVSVDKDGKISGVAAGKISADSTDAVNGSQLNAVATEAGKHSKVVNGNNTNVEETTVDGQKVYKVNLNNNIMVGDVTGKYVSISGTNGTIEATGAIATKDRVYADKGAKLADIDVTGNTISNGDAKLALNGAAGTAGIINGQGASVYMQGSTTVINSKVSVDKDGKISGVAAGEISSTSTDAINGSQLHQTNENVAANRADIDKNKADIAALDNRVTKNEQDIKQNAADIAQNKADIATNKADIATNKADIATNKANIAQNAADIKKVEALAKKHTTVTEGKNIKVTEGTNADGGKEYNVALDKDINLDSVTTGQTVMNNDGLKVGKDVSVTATAVTAGQTSISNDGLNVNGKTYVSDNGLNANDQKVTNVAAGEISATSKDAVNGSQLYATNQEVVNNTNRINKLGSRVNKVGAGAAALAALHPMDFDPDDKLTFSAGYGNYAGENAAAIGAYYRPDEKVMFSVAGTVGNGENMVNAGVSFALDRTNHVSNSRTALAREVIDLRGQLAVMGAKMAKMEKAFGMLDETKTKLFPDVPANHWAYEYIAKLAGNGYIEGYPDGNFGGDRLMTRYEFAAMLYRAIENGAALEEKIIKEFEPELGRIRVDRISGEDGDRDKIERVRVNDTKGERDHYGNKLAK